MLSFEPKVEEIKNREELKNQIPLSDYEILLSDDSVPVYSITTTKCVGHNDIFCATESNLNEDIDKLVNIEISVRRCKRVGFFEYSE